MSKLFISYSGRDRFLADALAARLKARGYDYFLDFQSIPGGAKWEQEIYEALKQSLALLVCATPRAMESRWVFAEITLARYSGLPVIPLIMEACSVPEHLHSTTQHIDFTNDPAEAYEKLWISLERLHMTPTHATWPRNRSPYPGLRALNEGDAPIFFARERELNDAITALRPGGQQKRFLAIVGPSGSGKSSLVRAGLIPALQRGAIVGSEQWLYVLPVLPGSTPFRNLAEKLRELDRQLGNVRDIEAQLREANGLLYTLLDARADAQRDQAQVVITIDQLEEIEHLTSHSERDDFLVHLNETLNAPSTPLIVLATLRADFVSACLQFPALAELLQAGTQLLGVMDRSALRQVILGPAHLVNLQFEDGLVDEILDDTKGGDALPLMAHTLEQLWSAFSRDTSSRMIERQVYKFIGGVTGALSQRAQQIYDDTPESDREALRQALVELADVNERGDFTRRRVQLIVLPARARSALERFVDARLLVTSGDVSDAEIEVTHEALLRNWPLLRSWLDAESNRLRLRREIDLAVRDWEAHRHSDAYLWRGERLAGALNFAATLAWPQDDLRRIFLETGRRHDQATLERESIMLANRVLRDYEDDPERGVLLALAAIEHYVWTPRAEFALNVCLAASRAGAQLRHDDAVLGAAFSPDGARIVTASDDRTGRIWDATSNQLLHTLQEHTGTVHSALFSPDGTHIITASNDRTAYIWDATSGQPVHILRGHTGAVLNAAFSLDGTRVVTTSDDMTGRIWDATSGQLLYALQGHTGAVLSAVFSSDGARIVTASGDTTARVWDAASGKLLHILTHIRQVNNANFNPDGTRIVTASDDKTARIWDVESGKLLHILKKHEDVVLSAAYSADGRHIVTASRDMTACVWDSASGLILRFLRGHTGAVLSAVFSMDGMRIVTASADKTVRIWDATAGLLLRVLQGHERAVVNATFAPDDRLIVTASHDHTARIWDATCGQALRTLQIHTSSVTSASFSPNGAFIVTTSRDKTAYVWDAASGRPLHILNHGTWVNNAAFNSDGTRIVTAAEDYGARIWDAMSARLLYVLHGHEASVRNAAFSPDSTGIVTASDDQTARIWDAKSGQLLHILQEHTGTVHSAVFSPDGTYILTASDDQTARIWDAKSGRPVDILQKRAGAVLSAAYSADGEHIVTVSDDKTARIWDATSGQLLHTLQGHTGAVLSAAFSPDGTRIVTASNDMTVRIWDAASGQPVHILQGHTGAVLSAAFSPDATRIVTASSDTTARLWQVPLIGPRLVAFAHTRVNRALTPQERREYGLPAIVS